jgi:predicted dienelactone hydrolase
VAIRWRLLLVLAFWATAGAAEATLYKIDTGPLPVRIIDDLTLTDPVQHRDIRLRVLYPEGPGPFPLVVFSTGAFCYPQMYDRITAHWASHGYIVVVPNHIESPNNDKPPTPAQYPDFLPSRVRDVSFIVDAADTIAARAGLEGKIDVQRLAIAGHSFGAVIATIKIGLDIKEEYQGAWGEMYDDRFMAAVLLSSPGPEMKEMAPNAFDGIRKPLIASGGTNDVGRVDLGDLTPAEWRMQAYLLPPPGDKYSVITEGTDHYMGGLICNAERGGEPDYAALKNVRSMTTTFLDAYIKQDAEAMTFLQTAEVTALMNGQASYQYR